MSLLHRWSFVEPLQNGFAERREVDNGAAAEIQMFVGCPFAHHRAWRIVEIPTVFEGDVTLQRSPPDYQRDEIRLADVLRGDAELGKVLVPTDRPGLSFLAAGGVDGRRPPLEDLSSFLTDALSEFSAVVADLPPALAGESVVLAWGAALEQIFVVVRNGVTPLALVRRAIEEVALEQPQIVLNRATAATGSGTAASRVAMT